MLKVKELIERLQKVNQEAYVIFDDDQKFFYPILEIEENPIDCSYCEDTNSINDCAPCSIVNEEVVKDYTRYCELHTKRDVVLFKTEYQQSSNNITL